MDQAFKDTPKYIHKIHLLKSTSYNVYLEVAFRQLISTINNISHQPSRVTEYFFWHSWPMLIMMHFLTICYFVTSIFYVKWHSPQILCTAGAAVPPYCVFCADVTRKANKTHYSSWIHLSLLMNQVSFCKLHDCYWFQWKMVPKSDW